MLAPILIALALTKQPVSICEVLRRPATYRKYLIDIRAEILLALPHGAVLVDKHCPDTGIPLGFDLPDADSSATDLVSKIMNGCAEPRPHQVAGVFRGRLVYSSNSRVELRLLSVRDLQITPCPAPPSTYRIRRLPIEIPLPTVIKPPDPVTHPS